MIIKAKIKERQWWQFGLGFLFVIIIVTFIFIVFINFDFLLALGFAISSLFGMFLIIELNIMQKFIWLDVDNHRFKNHKKYLFIEIPLGKWHSLPVIEKCVLRSRSEFVKTSGSYRSWQEYGYTEINYRIFLVNRSCKYSQLICHVTDKKLAESKLNELALGLNVRSEIIVD